MIEKLTWVLWTLSALSAGYFVWCFAMFMRSGWIGEIVWSDRGRWALRIAIVAAVAAWVMS